MTPDSARTLDRTDAPAALRPRATPRHLPRSLQGAWGAALVAALAFGAGCSDPGEEGTGDQFTDATFSFDAKLDTGSFDTGEPDVEDVKAAKGCSDDNHCVAFSQVCDKLTNTCVQCLTDQNCPQDAFCLDNVCVPDLCIAGETRCWGKPKATTHVALCKVNGGGWVPSLCEPGTYCSEGKCVPFTCTPGAKRCGSGAQSAAVLQCVDGVDEAPVEDCDKQGLVCQGGKCVDTSCSPGEVKCASDSVSLVCTNKAGKWRFEPVACADSDACTWDRCIVGKGCDNPGKPNGIACGKEKWCYEGQCTDVRNNLVVMFDTSGSMNFKVPGKTCYEASWPQCQDPHKSCSRMGVSKSVFKKAFVHVDSARTRLAMFRFPQLWLAPSRTTSPKPPHFKPPVACANGNYIGYYDMTGHGSAETVEAGSSWYWDHLDEVLCVGFPETQDVDPKPGILGWMDGAETYGSDSELRAIGGTPIGRTLFYVGEYLRHKVVVDGKKCAVDADCKNPNYLCKAGACADPMRSCRQTTVVIFTDGGEENYPDKLFSPWVQAKRFAYGLSCSADVDCVGGARCICPPGQANCAKSDRECLPEDLQTGYYCRSTMQSCLPEAQKGDPGYCPKAGGVQDCVKDPVVGVATQAKNMADNVLRSPDGVPFGVTVHVVDISGDKNALERSGNLARAGGGRLLASDDADEDGFLLNLRKAFDVAAKPACGLNSVACATPGGAGVPCDDGNPCTNDSCNKSTGTCSFVPNTGSCEDGDKCTLSERCLGGTCVSGIAQVDTLAGNGLTKVQEGNAVNVGMAGPRAVAVDGADKIYVSDGHRIARVDPTTALLTTWVGDEEAGTADGTGKEARFLGPAGLDFAPDGRLIVADAGNHRLRAVTPGGSVTTIAGGTQGFVDGPAASARFLDPSDVSVDPQGRVWVADTGNHRLRRLSADLVVTTIVGDGQPLTKDGPLASARTAYPQRVDIAPDGTLVLAERYTVRRLAKGVLGTLAGGQPGYANSTASKARFDVIGGIVADAAGGVWVADRDNHRIRYVDPQRAVSTLAGGTKPSHKDGYGSATRFWHPEGLVMRADGSLLVADFDNRRVRRVKVPRVACADGGPCNPGACDSKTGQCVSAPKPDGAPCDTDACVEGQACLALSCAGGTPRDCDDGQECTADACSEGACTHAPLKSTCDDGSPCTEKDQCDGGWCKGSPLDCDDNEPTTDDVCEAGQCLHRSNGPCKTDTDCYDGELVCTLDRCVDGACTYEATSAKGCCQAVLFAHDFNDGKLGGMQLNNAAPPMGWGVWADAQTETPPVFALYYGDPKAATFSGPSRGDALVPKVILPPGRTARLKLRLWLDVERAAIFDELRVVADVFGEEVVLWQKGPTTPQQGWHALDLDLSPFAGRQVRVRLSFDTVDDLYNDGKGVLADDVRIEVNCE